MDSACLTNGSIPRWHLVFTKPLGENTAKINLERQGFRVYFPRVQEKVLSRGKWRDRIGALFPRYLFVQLNAAMQSLAPIRSTLGVANVVRFGTEFVTVPELVVNELIEREDVSGVHRLSLGPLFKPGSIVRVIEGALAGLEGIFERGDANDRVVVLLKLLGCETRIRLPAASVMPDSLAY